MISTALLGSPPPTVRLRSILWETRVLRSSFGGEIFLKYLKYEDTHEWVKVEGAGWQENWVLLPLATMVKQKPVLGGDITIFPNEVDVVTVCKPASIPVIDYYTKKGIVANLHVEKPPKEVTVEVQKTMSCSAYSPA
uniref:Uncharacterized protein n=1 Tax=Oryza brachyantha TaxID=4533 RepID=J3KV55_ORYBR